jgi:hypothetical protein
MNKVNWSKYAVNSVSFKSQISPEELSRIAAERNFRDRSAFLNAIVLQAVKVNDLTLVENGSCVTTDKAVDTLVTQLNQYKAAFQELDCLFTELATNPKTFNFKVALSKVDIQKIDEAKETLKHE